MAEGGQTMSEIGWKLAWLSLTAVYYTDRQVRDVLRCLLSGADTLLNEGPKERLCRIVDIVFPESLIPNGRD
jgi:hypothetical protein